MKHGPTIGFETVLQAIKYLPGGQGRSESLVPWPPGADQPGSVGCCRDTAFQSDIYTARA